MQAEKKAIEVKFNEVSLKLKQKTHQYETLLKSQDGQEQNNIEKSLIVSTGTQTIKDEPREIGIVNVPASSSSRPNATKTGTKRKNVTKDDSEKNKTKKVQKSNPSTPTTRKSTQSKDIFTCDECLCQWGNHIKSDFQGDPDRNGAPDPKQNIQTFPSFEAYRDHLCNAHKILNTDRYYCCPDKDFVCKICNCSFNNPQMLAIHEEFEHIKICPDMTNRQFFDLYLKYSQHGLLI